MELLNQYALDHYLRGEGGELARKQAQQELYRRGQESVTIPVMTEQEMVNKLKVLGYVVFKPRER